MTTTTSTVETSTVDCTCRFAYRLTPETHSLLTGWAGKLGWDGGVGQVLAYFSEWLGEPYARGNLGVMDFPDFVAEHNWPDPAAALQLAASVAEMAAGARLSNAQDDPEPANSATSAVYALRHAREAQELIHHPDPDADPDMVGAHLRIVIACLETEVESEHMVARKVARQACPCEFDKAPITHDRLMAIETLPPLEAAELVTKLVLDEDMLTDEAESLFSDPDDFGRFVQQHNWRDPVAVASLASYADPAANRALIGRRRQEAGVA